MAVQNKTAKILFRVILSVLIALSIASITATILLQGIAALIKSTLGIFGITTLGAEALGAFFFLIFRKTRENTPPFTPTLTAHDSPTEQKQTANDPANSSQTKLEQLLDELNRHGREFKSFKPLEDLLKQTQDGVESTEKKQLRTLRDKAVQMGHEPLILLFHAHHAFENTTVEDYKETQQHLLKRLGVFHHSCVVPPPSLPLTDAIIAGKLEDALNILNNDPTAKKRTNQFDAPEPICRLGVWGSPLFHLLKYSIEHPMSLENKHFKPLLKALLKAGADWNFIGISSDRQWALELPTTLKLTVYTEILQQLSPCEYWPNRLTIRSVEVNEARLGVYSFLIPKGIRSFMNDKAHLVEREKNLAALQTKFLSLCQKRNVDAAKECITHYIAQGKEPEKPPNPLLLLNEKAWTSIPTELFIFLIEHTPAKHINKFYNRRPLLCNLMDHPKADQLISEVLRLKKDLFDLDLWSNDGSALSYAVTQKKFIWVEMLLKAGANPNLGYINRSQVHWSPLDKARFPHSNLKMIELLLKSGADPNSTGEMGATPLWQIIDRAEDGLKRKDFLIAKQLIKYGANILARPLKNSWGDYQTSTIFNLLSRPGMATSTRRYLAKEMVDVAFRLSSEESKALLDHLRTWKYKDLETTLLQKKPELAQGHRLPPKSDTPSTSVAADPQTISSEESKTKDSKVIFDEKIVRGTHAEEEHKIPTSLKLSHPCDLDPGIHARTTPGSLLPYRDDEGGCRDDEGGRRNDESPSTEPLTSDSVCVLKKEEKKIANPETSNIRIPTPIYINHVSLFLDTTDILSMVITLPNFIPKDRKPIETFKAHLVAITMTITLPMLKKSRITSRNFVPEDDKKSSSPVTRVIPAPRQTLLLSAVKQHRLDIALRLVEDPLMTIHINQFDSKQVNAIHHLLHSAPINDQFKPLLEALLAAGADSYLAIDSGSKLTAICGQDWLIHTLSATSRRNSELQFIAQLLTEQIEKNNEISTLQEKFWSLLLEGNLDQIKAFITEYCSRKKQQKLTYNPLLLLDQDSWETLSEDVFICLIENTLNKDLNKFYYGETLLCRLILHHQDAKGLITALLSRKKDVMDLDLIGLHGSALYRAVGIKDLELIKILLAAGANPNIGYLGTTKNINLGTPLENAIRMRYEEGFNALLKAGANPNMPSSSGNSCLWDFIFEQRFPWYTPAGGVKEFAIQLILFGADPTIYGSKKKPGNAHEEQYTGSIFDMLSHMQKTRQDYLIAMVASAHKLTTTACEALYQKLLEWEEYFLAIELLKKQPPIVGESTLHFAVRMKRLDLVKSILERDKSLLNKQDQQGNTALHLAAGSGQRSMYSFLETQGAKQLENTARKKPENLLPPTVFETLQARFSFGRTPPLTTSLTVTSSHLTQSIPKVEENKSLRS